jgi:hypothetical protein
MEVMRTSVHLPTDYTAEGGNIRNYRCDNLSPTYRVSVSFDSHNYSRHVYGNSKDFIGAVCSMQKGRDSKKVWRKQTNRNT